MRILLHAKWLVFITLLVNAAAMLTPVINAGDSVTYAALSQHMVLHNDWINLVLDGEDWLDKPHFPFWITALFFKIGGISAFTYVLPGFLFHLIGGYYTYRIARLFHNRETAWIALLVYVSAYHLMYTSGEVKAETYLTGCIVAASYYWLRYDAAAKLKYLLLGALFTAMAVMTKGVFTLITITSGLVCMWLYQKQWHKLWSAKWLGALAVSLLFTAPELLALYLQFDAHPEKCCSDRRMCRALSSFCGTVSSAGSSIPGRSRITPAIRSILCWRFSGLFCPGWQYSFRRSILQCAASVISARLPGRKLFTFWVHFSSPF